VFTGDPFDTPTDQGTVGGAQSCRAPSCDCIDIGDVGGDFEPPRACEITVHVTFSGNDIVGKGGPLTKGDPVALAKVTGELSGGSGLPIDDTICGSSPCNNGSADAKGSTTFVVPIVGDAPSLQVKADYSVEQSGTYHYYTGSISVTGCARDHDTLGETIELELDHAALGDLGAYIDSLGAGPTSGGATDGGLVPDIKSLSAPKGCACRVGDAPNEHAGFAGLGLVLVAGYHFARRTRRKSEPERV
jgi:MYXO-CTERM domain-containing protein